MVSVSKTISFILRRIQIYEKTFFLAAAMAAVMALSVTACSGGSSAPETKAPESAEASKAEETSKAEN